MGKEKEEEKEEEKKDLRSEPGARNRVRAKFRGGEELEESDDRVGSECRRMEVRADSGNVERAPSSLPSRARAQR